MKRRTKGILAFLFLGGLMVTSGVTIAIQGIDPLDEKRTFIQSLTPWEIEKYLYRVWLQEQADIESLTTSDRYTEYGIWRSSESIEDSLPCTPDSPEDICDLKQITPDDLTPAYYYTNEQRPQFCGSSIARSTDYVQEFSIPTACTNPLGIVTDYDGNVWFAQTNTGRMAMFDPITETFTEYDNPVWPPGTRSMMWGADYSPDGYVWYTDDASDSIWRFSPASGQYERLGYPSETDSLPQRLVVDGSQIIINDFTGNKLTLLTTSPDIGEIRYVNVPSPFDNSQTADFAVAPDNSVWFTTWSLQSGGVLTKFDQDSYAESTANPDNIPLPTSYFMEIFAFPENMLTPNGAAFTADGTLWLADTTSSSFYSFDPSTERFTQYVTADPLPGTYGNHTGIVKSPISRPYWIQADETGNLVFNSQNSNNLSVMNPALQTLVEYHVPSKNPHWADCSPGNGTLIADCGLAQIFDFTVHGKNIWFTEWVENNIGVVDTSVPLPFDIQTDKQTVILPPGEAATVNLQVTSSSSSSSSSMSEDAVDGSLVLSGTHDFITVGHEAGPDTLKLFPGGEVSIVVDITASDDAVPGTYKVLLGVQSPDVAVGKFVTVTVQ